MDPNQLLSPPAYNQPIAPPVKEQVDDPSDALNIVTKAYNEASDFQDKYTELWRQLWQLWRFYRSADSAVKVFDPIGFSITQGLLSKIFVQAPKTVLTSEDGQWRWLAKILQAYLEHQFANPDSDEPMEEEFISFITELLVLGTAVGKVSWCTKFITQFQEQTDPTTGEVTRQPVEVKAFDDPIFEHIPREKFFIQPGAKSISQSRYAIYEKEVNLSYLEDLQKIVDPLTNQPLYNIPPEALESQTLPADNNGGIEMARQPAMANSSSNQLTGWWQLLEYWEDDKYIVVLNKKWVIRGPEDNPNDDGKKPFVALSYSLVPHMFDGIGALEPTMDLQRAQNITLTQRLEFVSNLLNQQFAVVGRLDATDEDALIDGYPIVHVQTADAITPLNKGGIPQASFLTAGELVASIERTSGLSGYSNGTPSSAQDKTQGTKGGIQSIIMEAQSRFNMTLRRFENVVLRGVASRFLALDRQYFSETESKMILVTDSQQSIPVPLTKELLLASKFHVSIVPGSTGVVDKEAKAQRFMGWAQFGSAMIPNFNRELAVIEAGEYQDIERPERFVTAMPAMPTLPGQPAPGALPPGQSPPTNQPPANAQPV